ncbi:unnamed protein product, partial [Ixodes hexagonus]
QAGASFGPQPREPDARLAAAAVAAPRPATFPVISSSSQRQQRRHDGGDDNVSDVSAFSRCPDGRFVPSRRDSASSTDSYASWTAGQGVAMSQQRQPPRRHEQPPRQGYEHRQVPVGACTLPRGCRPRRGSTGDAYETPRYENLAFLHRSLKENAAAAATATVRPRGGRRTCRVSAHPQADLQRKDSVDDVGGN